ncbi:MAG: GH116 family glycosyl-hydrolase, partial [Planctomycetota bacterium]
MTIPLHETCTTYSGETLAHVLVPFGGLGTGTVSLAGDGRLAEFQIRHRPDQDSIPGLSCLALRSRWPDGQDARLLEGPVRPPFHRHALRAGGSYHPGLGLGTAGLFGLPRCRQVSCRLGYPFLRVDLADPDCPVEISLEAWNPLVPLDSTASSQPVLALRVHLHNPRAYAVTLDLAASLRNPFHLAAAGMPQQRLRQSDQLSLLELTDPGLEDGDPAQGAIGWATSHPRISARPTWPALPWMASETRFWEQFTRTGTWAADGLPGDPYKPVGSL